MEDVVLKKSQLKTISLSRIETFLEKIKSFMLNETWNKSRFSRDLFLINCTQDCSYIRSNR